MIRRAELALAQIGSAGCLIPYLNEMSYVNQEFKSVKPGIKLHSRKSV